MEPFLRGGGGVNLPIFSKSYLNIAYILDKFIQISYFVNRYAILSQIHYIFSRKKGGKEAENNFPTFFSEKGRKIYFLTPFHREH